MSGAGRDPITFCRAVLHEYERQWASAGGHSVRHPLRLKIERLQDWCSAGDSDPEQFESQLRAAHHSDDPGTALLAEELEGLWAEVRAGRRLPFDTSDTPGERA